jgi:hypothetical protein
LDRHRVHQKTVEQRRHGRRPGAYVTAHQLDAGGKLGVKERQRALRATPGDGEDRAGHVTVGQTSQGVAGRRLVVDDNRGQGRPDGHLERQAPTPVHLDQITQRADHPGHAGHGLSPARPPGFLRRSNERLGARLEPVAAPVGVTGGVLRRFQRRQGGLGVAPGFFGPLR